MPLQATSGAASYDAFGGGVPVVPQYIEDVFSTYLYTGNGSTQTITNGIDLAGEGGLVWLKCRNSAENNEVYDTVRGANQRLITNTIGAQVDRASSMAFSSTGLSWVGDNISNTNGNTYASWTFRKQEKFFDVVTWSGNDASNRQIAHNLGSVPGCIIVKTTGTDTDWNMYHRSLGNTKALYLNLTQAQETNTNWGNTTPTSSVFTTNLNGVGNDYIAYLFAHDAGGFGLTGTDNVISCGSFTADGSGVASVTLGYEPQWLLTKSSSGTSSWMLLDNMRGWVSGAGDYPLYANLTNTEGASTSQTAGDPTATGFTTVLNPSATYIYIAIRRGPMKVPTDGTSVFSPVTYTGNGSSQSLTAGFPIDLSLFKYRGGATNSFEWFDRLRGTSPELRSAYTYAELATTTEVTSFASNTQVTVGASSDTGGTNVNGQTYILEAFRRAPSFFDEVCYTGGTGTPRVLNHNLAVAPELVITKVRNFSGEDWVVNYSNGSTIIGGYLNSTSAFANSSTAPSTDITSLTSTTYTLNTSNRRVNGAYNYVAYLFATCAGVSKVGSYTGTATTLQVDCGFTGGARFVLIKRTDSTGDWYVWDSARGIVAGDDPYLLLNSTAAEVTNTDYVDTYSAGFEISSTAPAAINASGGTFIFLAIA